MTFLKTLEQTIKEIEKQQKALEVKRKEANKIGKKTGNYDYELDIWALMNRLEITKDNVKFAIDSYKKRKWTKS